MYENEYPLMPLGESAWELHTINSHRITLQYYSVKEAYDFNNQLPDQLALFAIDILVESPSHSAQKDQRVRNTICNFLFKRLTYHNEAILYILEGLDGRALARQRLFNQWFLAGNQHYYEPIVHLPILVSDLPMPNIPCGLYVAAHNPYITLLEQSVNHYAQTVVATLKGLE